MTGPSDASFPEPIEAIPTDSLQGVVDPLRNLLCSSCSGARLLPKAHVLRRSVLHYYWIVTVRCDQGHESTVTFQVDWITGGEYELPGT